MLTKHVSTVFAIGSETFGVFICVFLLSISSMRNICLKIVTNRLWMCCRGGKEFAVTPNVCVMRIRLSVTEKDNGNLLVCGVDGEFVHGCFLAVKVYHACVVHTCRALTSSQWCTENPPIF